MSRPSLSADSPPLTEGTPPSASRPSSRRLAWRSLAVNLLLAAVLTGVAGFVAVRMSTNYYTLAPYHHDSAAYRHYAAGIAELRGAQGVAPTLTEVLKSKDPLDVVVRVLLFPHSLVQLHGHLSVLLPFMWLFIWLTVHYVYTRTRSRACSVAIPALLFTLPIVYNPLIVGIADYWKDNLAVWLLGGAVMSFLLSEGLQRLPFAGLSGTLLGLLAMQRAVLAVYAAPLFLPLVVVATVRRLRAHGARDTALRLGTFAAGPLAIVGWLLLTQGRQLYHYYFVVGYGYSTMLGSAKFLAAVVWEHLGIAPLLLLASGLLLAAWVALARKWEGSSLVGVWVALALPLGMIASRALYFGFAVTWMVLLVVLLATVFPAFLGTRRTRTPFVIGLVLLASVGSWLQYRSSVGRADLMARVAAPKRRFQAALSETILGVPGPRRVALLYDEETVPFMNHLFFDRHVPSDPAAGVSLPPFISVHDSLYRVHYAGVPQPQIPKTIIASLEAQPGTLAVGLCKPEAMRTGPIFAAEGRQVAMPIAIELNQYVLTSPRWVVLRKLDSPYGCMHVYQYRPESPASGG